MKRIFLWLLGALLIALGLLVEAGMIGGFVALINSPVIILILLVVVFAVLIGNCIFKYGWNYTEEYDEKEDITL
ncbi:hypothetical protein [Zhenhengia yiwuensis]|uniref:Uncharacterized protein n=1 Tax=Zhenhengia yiwuensis TaxID=2763666 RepID=A0A926IG37_9FIRM|nr:hypothetical protein [Zhenhengia yiwuensis]MBC8581664.1 hypothetical protein [Zhenhengia yiwuensis]